MPLRAVIEGQVVIAPLLSDAAWDALRARALERGLRVELPCCDREGYLRRSQHGTRHFAHKRGKPGDPACEHEGETVHHLTAKAAIITAARTAGYLAAPEVAREGWRADVLAVPDGARPPSPDGTRAPSPDGARAPSPDGARAPSPDGAGARTTGGDAWDTANAAWAAAGTIPRGAIAFEVQWSHLSLEDCQFRQARYAADGVRGCWFFRQPPPALALAPDDARELAATRELPLFHLWGHADRTFTVSLHHVHVPLGRFVAALLGREIAFAEYAATARTQTLQVAPVVSPCRACRRRFTVWHVEPVLTSACGLRVPAAQRPDADAPDAPDWMTLARLPAVAAAAQHAPADAPRAALTDAGFVCPACGAAHDRAAIDHALYGTDAVTLAHQIDGFTVEAADMPPLRVPFAHWCWPTAEGGFCTS
jgi:hypothetical protein